MKKTIFFMLCLAMLTFFTSLKASIVYTDIPDGQPASIDLNGDGTADFSISNMIGTGDYITYPNGNNIIASGTTSSGWDTPQPMQLNDAIGSTGNFIGAGDCAVAEWGGTTTFPLNVDRYIGVKFVVGSNTYYGWIRVNITGNSSDYIVTYKDFAYENTPNSTILAGNKPAGINEYAFINDNGFKFLCNENNVKIVAEEANNTINTVELFSINGQLIKTINAFNSNTVSVDINNMNNGVYLLMILTDNKKPVTHKIVR